MFSNWLTLIESNPLITGLITTVIGGLILWRLIRWFSKPPSNPSVEPSSGSISVANSPGAQTVVGNNNEISQVFNQGTKIMVNGRSGGPDYRRHPTPKEIATAIEDVAPYSRPDIFKTFLNIAVDWDVEFRTVQKSPLITDPDIYSVALADPNSNRLMVFCGAVNIEKGFPILKLLKYGDRLRVRGVISSVDGLTITLTNVEFVVPENIVRKK